LAREDHTIALTLDKNKEGNTDLNFSWQQKMSPTFKYAYLFNLSSQKGSVPSSTIAGDYKVDEDTTVRGKLSVGSNPSKLRLGLAVAQTLSAHTFVTLGADINASSILGDGVTPDHTFGFEIKLK